MSHLLRYFVWIHANLKTELYTRTYLPSRHKQQSIQWYQHQKLMHYKYTYQLLTLKRVCLPIRNANLICNTPSIIMSVHKNDKYMQAVICLFLCPFNLNIDLSLGSDGILRELTDNRHPFYTLWANNSSRPKKNNVRKKYYLKITYRHTMCESYERITITNNEQKIKIFAFQEC